MLPDVTLSDTERDDLLNRAADAVVRRRLEAPAVLFLELHRPLSFLSSQALIVVSPFLAGFFGAENVLRIAKLLEDPRNVERLMDRIEEAAAGRQRDGAPVTAEETAAGVP